MIYEIRHPMARGTVIPLYGSDVFIFPDSTTRLMDFPPAIRSILRILFRIPINELIIIEEKKFTEISIKRLCIMPGIKQCIKYPIILLHTLIPTIARFPRIRHTLAT